MASYFNLWSNTACTVSIPGYASPTSLSTLASNLSLYYWQYNDLVGYNFSTDVLGNGLTANSVTGRTFLGWYTTAANRTSDPSLSDFTQLITNNALVTSAQVQTCKLNTSTSAYLICAKYSYNLTYTPYQSIETASQTQTKICGQSATLRGAIFTRTGYTQTGWSTTAGGTKDYDLSEVITNDITTLYPVWTINTYTVTFADTYGNALNVLKTETVNHGGNATPPANPTNEHYNFSNWDRSYTNVTEDITVAVVWTPKTYELTFVTHGGTINSGSISYHTYGIETILPTDVTKTGHTFLGWSLTDDENISFITKLPSSFAQAITFYAKWQRSTYTVSLTTNGGTINSGKITSYTYGNGATLPTNVTRSGHTFAGWYDNVSCSGNPITNITADSTGAKSFYAKWLPTFTVTFADHDGTVLKRQTVNQGGNATPPANPTRVGYTFSSWNGAYANVTANVTVTAVYTINTYTVTFCDYDGTTLKSETVNHGGNATPPTTNPAHEGYTFIGWDGVYTNITQDTNLLALFNGAANYTLRGCRWQRLYTAATNTPAYSASTDAALAAASLCSVPWTEVSADRSSCLTAHPGTEESDTHNVDNREYFDAAAFCAGHDNGMHRVYMQATCYRFALPSNAVGKRMNSLSLVVSGDPYLRDGARIAVLTNSTGVIPTDCQTCRNGNAHLEGVAKRTSSSDGSRWYGKSERVYINPQDGITLGSFLFVFVLLENYSYTRGDYIEGSACIQPNIEIGMASVVSGWSTSDVNLCTGGSANSYIVNRWGTICLPSTNITGYQTIRVSSVGSTSTGTSYDTKNTLGLRALYAAFYEGRMNLVTQNSNATAHISASFVVRTNNDDWQLSTSMAFIPFAVPISWRANKVRLSYNEYATLDYTGGKLNVWLKRGSYISSYPESVIKNPELYLANARNVDGYELLGTIDAANYNSTVTFNLDTPLTGYVATIVLTAFISLDDLNPDSDTTLPLGINTALDIDVTTPANSHYDYGWQPQITLLG